MRKAVLVGGALVVLALLALGVGYRVLERERRRAEAATPSTELASTETWPEPESHQGFLHGRITTTDGDRYEGRLRWGGGDAFWGDDFFGRKSENPWRAHLPTEDPEQRRSVSIFGVKISERKTPLDLERPFLSRYGDIARIEPNGRELRVTLKSGTVFELDRYELDDLGSGLRVWDGSRGVVDLDEWGIRTIELLPGPSLADAPYRLQGTVRTSQVELTGFIQWDREKGVGTDELHGRTPEGLAAVSFEGIATLEREAGDGARVTLLDGREIVLREVVHRKRGLLVEDRRYGRVKVGWEILQGIEFESGGSGPAYDDFPPGRPLSGGVTTRDGARLAGRLVYDLDESETTETLDAPSGGLDYNLPFGLIASIVPAARGEGAADRASVTLHDGEELQLEPTGDLGENNAGMLVFVEGGQHAEYVPWTDVERIDFERPPAMDP